jgi:hypothetical protein
MYNITGLARVPEMEIAYKEGRTKFTKKELKAFSIYCSIPRECTQFSFLLVHLQNIPSDLIVMKFTCTVRIPASGLW